MRKQLCAAQQELSNVAFEYSLVYNTSDNDLSPYNIREQFIRMSIAHFDILFSNKANK